MIKGSNKEERWAGKTERIGKGKYKTSAKERLENSISGNLCVIWIRIEGTKSARNEAVQGKDRLDQ